MTQEHLPGTGRYLPRNLGTRVWVALTGAFRRLNTGVNERMPSLQLNAASTANSPEAKNALYSAGDHNAGLSPAAASPALELIEMEMRLRLKWLSH